MCAVEFAFIHQIRRWNENIGGAHASGFVLEKREKFRNFRSVASEIRMGKTNKCSDLNLNDSGSLFFWGLIVLLFILVIGNFILTLSIISFFKIGMGMDAIKLIPELKMIKFYGSADFNRIYKKDGLIESFRDSPVVIECEIKFLKFPTKIKN